MSISTDLHKGAADSARGWATPEGEAYAGLVVIEALSCANLDGTTEREVLQDVARCLACPWWEVGATSVLLETDGAGSLVACR